MKFEINQGMYQVQAQTNATEMVIPVFMQSQCSLRRV